MKITAISSQKRDENRVNISVDGKYRFSLDIYQVADLGIKVGREYDETELVKLEAEGEFGKAYSRALEYCLMRPHSSQEMRNYLYKKTRSTRRSNGETRLGISPENASRVFDRLVEKGYVNDLKFTEFWVNNRFINKGISQRKLVSELRAKGVDKLVIDQVIGENVRSDTEEIAKVITKKRSHYLDDNKLIAYLVRQGFDYDDIKRALAND